MRCRPDNSLELSEFLRGSGPSVPALRSHVSPARGRTHTRVRASLCHRQATRVALFFDRPQQACGDQYNTRRNNISSSRRTGFRGDSARGKEMAVNFFGAFS